MWPGAVLGTQDTFVNQTRKDSCPHGTESSAQRDRENQCKHKIASTQHLKSVKCYAIKWKVELQKGNQECWENGNSKKKAQRNLRKDLKERK